MSEETPDRIKATITIELDFAKEDQPMISGVLENIIESLSISGSGKGSATKNSHYSYKVESNLPSKPMTMERLFELFDANREPNEPTAMEKIQDSMHPEYEQAIQWWEDLTELQQKWFIETHPEITTFTKAWETFKNYSEEEKVALHVIGLSDKQHP